MVVCKYFQQGNCRFGTTCTNEHFDVKHIIKSDIETAINSKQWPLSCYGPFKDKACIPNFIEDQSFEELRLMCYQARQKNNFEQFNQQFTQGVIEANNKMKSMLQPTPQIIELACKIYDTQSVESGTPAQSMFENAATSSGSTFGNSIFNANSNINTPTTANLFGTNNNNNNNNNNLFAQPQQQQQTSTIFGQKANNNNFSFVNNNTNLNNINNSSSGGNLFENASLPQSGSGLFAQTAVQQNSAGFNNLFTQQPGTQTNATVFNQNPFGQQQQPQQQTGSGIFAQKSNSMFLTQPVQQQPPPSGLFAQAAIAQNTMTQQQVQGQSMFGQQQQHQSSANPAVSGGNIFAQQQQPQQQTQQCQLTNNTPTGLFQQNATPAAPPANAASSVYSRMEDLTPDEIEAFQSPIFLPGKIPCCPPPREFVN